MTSSDSDDRIDFGACFKGTLHLEDSTADDPPANDPLRGKKKRKAGPSTPPSAGDVLELGHSGPEITLQDSPQLNPQNLTTDDLFDALNMAEGGDQPWPSSGRKYKKQRLLNEGLLMFFLSPLIKVNV